LEGLPTLGKLNPNFDYMILNDQDCDDAEGELCLIGPNVAAGYFNDIERSSASFFTLHESGRFMKRMYKTGDLVKEINDQLYFIGRKDNQVKHMGYRIELEEIEAAIHAVPGVVQAAVVYKRTNAAYGKIYCYLESQAEFDESVALKQLSNKLPEYMIPNRITVMDVLPKNANGKVDRKALAEIS
jgi:D-alanine--poly(phosphoribitol) ligase subunit 1